MAVNNFKVSIIISVYKDLESLGLILESLINQTYKEFEIVVSEDGNSDEIKEFLKKYNNINLVHSYHEDIGWRKNIALNNAVRKSSGEYLIFIDGDVIPYSNFIERHIQLSKKQEVLCGKRLELGSFFSKLIRDNTLSISFIERFYIFLLLFLIIDRARHIEEGMSLSPDGVLSKRINSKKRIMLLGCNFSCFKEDLESINGFDEDYNIPSVGEDIDLMWRFKYFNIKLKSIRNLANMFHLWHPRNWNRTHRLSNEKIMKEKRFKKEYRCKNGLIKE